MPDRRADTLRSRNLLGYAARRRSALRVEGSHGDAPGLGWASLSGGLQRGIDASPGRVAGGAAARGLVAYDRLKVVEATPLDDKSFCPECGAPACEGMTCWEQLGLLISWEFDDPELRALHFLTVACYNLQHPAQFTDEALAGLRSVFVEYLDNGMAITEIRRRMGKLAEGERRVLKDKSAQRVILRQWSMTIADVYVPSKPAGAAARVQDWASTIRNEL